MKIYFATSNLGKLKEFQEKLKNTKITVEHLDIPYPEIQSDYLEEIARFGAKYLTDKINETVIVEDSGLFVEKLNGFPGPYSKHAFCTIGYNGILKLLKNIDDRNAHFKTVIGYCNPGKEPILFKGVCNGKITKEPRGNNGFGYDPIFIPEGSNITFAEMETREKNKFSHRGKSIESFVNFLKLITY